MNRLICLLLSLLLLSSVGCVGRAAPLPPDEELEGAVQSSAIHAQAPPDAVQEREESSPEEAEPPMESPAEEAPYVRVVDPSKPMVALTFDDGPHELYTDQILDALEEHHAVATFFEVGRNVALYPQPLPRMDELGCEIASHSNAHRDLSKMRKGALLSDLDAADEAFIAAVGRAPTLVRPPYGAVNKTVKYASGRTMVTWTVDTEDWRYQDAQSVIDYVQSLSRLDGQIILMHSTYESTAQAAAVLVPWLQEMGYQLVTVSELMAYYYGELPQPDQFYGYTYFTTHTRTDSPVELPEAPPPEAEEVPDPGVESESPPPLPESPLPEEPVSAEEPAEDWAPYPEQPQEPVDTEPPNWLLT